MCFICIKHYLYMTRNSRNDQIGCLSVPYQTAFSDLPLNGKGLVKFRPLKGAVCRTWRHLEVMLQIATNCLLCVKRGGE